MKRKGEKEKQGDFFIDIVEAFPPNEKLKLDVKYFSQCNINLQYITSISVSPRQNEMKAYTEENIKTSKY